MTSVLRGAVSSVLLLVPMVMGGTTECQAGGITAVGGFLGEPTGISVNRLLHVDRSRGWFEVNLGWSARRDHGFDLNGSYQWPILGDEHVWIFVGAGPRVSFFEDTEYGAILITGARFFMPSEHHTHEIYFELGPSVAFHPSTTTSLYGVVGYRFLM